MGDYYDMESDEESAHLAWAATLNGEQDVFYARISPLVTSLKEQSESQNPLSLSCVPNPSKGIATIRFTAPESTSVELTLHDIYGKELRVLKNCPVQSPLNSLKLDTSLYPDGFYFCRLKAGKWTKSIKIAVM